MNGRGLWSHFFFTFAGAVLSVFFGDSPERPNLWGLWKAFLQLPVRSAHVRAPASSPLVSDTEAFRRPLGGYFRDRFTAPDQARRTRASCLSRPIRYARRYMAGGLHVPNRARADGALFASSVVLLDHDWEQWDHAEFEQSAASAEYLVRQEGKPKSLDPSFLMRCASSRTRIWNGCCIARSTHAPWTWCS